MEFIRPKPIEIEFHSSRGYYCFHSPRSFVVRVIVLAFARNKSYSGYGLACYIYATLIASSILLTTTLWKMEYFLNYIDYCELLR